MPTSRHPLLYRAHGLVIASDLPLPEFRAVEGPASADAVIETGPLPATLEDARESGPWWQAREDAYQFVAEGIARYRVEHGRRIVVDPLVDADGHAPRPGDVRLFLLGTALGALLHQRAAVPLHVSAVATPAGAWAFTGPSGAGKSTLAAWLRARHGWPLVSDDVAVLTTTDRGPQLEPGPARLKLWKDALAALGMSEAGLVRDLTRADKFHLEASAGLQATAVPLRAIVALDAAPEGTRPSLEQLQGQDAFRVILSSIYRPELALHFHPLDALFRRCAECTDRIAVYRYRRPPNLPDFEDALGVLLAEIDRASR